jgi:hypothetical protein
LITHDSKQADPGAQRTFARENRSAGHSFSTTDYRKTFSRPLVRRYRDWRNTRMHPLVVDEQWKSIACSLAKSYVDDADFPAHISRDQLSTLRNTKRNRGARMNAYRMLSGGCVESTRNIERDYRGARFSQTLDGLYRIANLASGSACGSCSEQRVNYELLTVQVARGANSSATESGILRRDCFR